MSRNGRTMVPGGLRPMASNIAPNAAGGSFRIARLTAKRGQIHDLPAIPSKQASSDSTMFMSNPFAELSASVPPAVMQTYVVVMAFLVAGGTLFDIVHKKSATYFFNSWRNSTNKAKQQIGGAEMVDIAVRTAVVDVMASGEFCNMQRRVAHLLTMYGFVIYVVTTVIMVFVYPTPAAPTPANLPTLWYIGALMVCLGGYWFWFFIRVDVAAEGNSPFRFVRADLFIVSLVLSVTFGLLWACVQATGNVAWTYVFRLCISSSPRCCLDQLRGPSSRICSSSRCCPGEKSSRSKWHEEQPAGSCRRAQYLRERPPTDPTLLIGPISAFDTGDKRTMPTFVYMTRCDGCGQCVDICPSDIMHIDTTYRRAFNIEPNMC